MSITSKSTQALELLASKLVVLHNEHGDLQALLTTEKGTLVGSLNELKNAIDLAISSSGAVINDGVTATDSVWSSSKVDSEIVSKIAAALEGEDLSDLAASVAALAAADNNLVSVESSQSFTSAQQSQGRANLAAASAASVSLLVADIGNEGQYDPVAAVNAILNF